MAGGILHTVKETDLAAPNYRGTGLLENMGDMAEGVDEMMFVILSIWHRWGGDHIVPPLIEDYNACCRGERPWPSWWQPEED